MRIGIVGDGRLGRSLAALAGRAGHEVQVFGRGGDPDADVVLLTVPDRAIGQAAGCITRARVLLHCSGATDLAPLRPHPHAGSLHPLMTFPGPHALPDLEGVFAAVAGEPLARSQASALARSLGMVPLEVTGDRRLYHAAAVLAGNFGTVLLAEAVRVLRAAGVDADARALIPLAVQSLRNAATDPSAALTGPVARGDHAVVEAHRTALDDAGLDDVRALYDALAERAVRLASTDPRNR